MSIAAQAGQIAVCLVLFFVLLALAWAVIASAARPNRITTAYVGSTWGPIEMESFTSVEAPQLERYRALHSEAFEGFPGTLDDFADDPMPFDEHQPP